MTPRMHLVYLYRRAGFSNKEVALRLHIATATVKAHVAALIRLGWL